MIPDREAERLVHARIATAALGVLVGLVAVGVVFLGLIYRMLTQGGWQ
jgi:hypothetical protein